MQMDMEFSRSFSNVIAQISVFNISMISTVFLICFDLLIWDIKSKTQTKPLSKSSDYINISESISIVRRQIISDA